jgi:hypothetical protein
LTSPLVASIVLFGVTVVALFSNLILVGDEKQVMTSLLKDRRGKRA